MVISVSLEPAGWINLMIYIQHVCRNRIITDFFFKRSIYIYIYIFFFLAALGVSHTLGIFAVSCGIFRCGSWTL